MISILLLCILILILWAIGSNNTSTFRKDKTLVLKAILPLLIICHHISVFGGLDFRPIGIFREWGFLVVGIFFFISGFGLMKSFEIKHKEYLNGFLYKKIYRSLFVPYLLACILFYCVLQILDNPIDVKSIIYNFFDKGDTFLPYSWFVIVIMMCYSIFLFAVKWFPTHSLLTISILTLILMSTLYLYGLPSFWIVSLPSFPLGAAFSKCESKIIKLFSNKHRLIIPLLFLIILTLTIKFFTSEERLLVKYGIISLLITVAFIFSTFVLKCQKIVRLSIIMFLSSISYEMYLTHGIVMMLLKNDLYRIDNPLLYIPLLFCGTIALSWLIYFSRKKISKKIFSLAA